MRFDSKHFVKFLPVIGGILGLVLATAAVYISIFYIQNKKLPFTDLTDKLFSPQNKSPEASAVTLNYPALEKLAESHPQGEEYLARIRTNEGYLNDGDPSNDVEAYMAIGFSLRQLGDNRGAAASYTRVLQLNPQNLLALSNLAVSYADLGEYDTAAHAYRALIESSPGDIPPYRSLADLYWYKMPEKKGEIPGLLEQGLARRPEHPDLLVYLAIYYKNVGDTPKAIEYFERTIVANPENVGAKAELEALKGR